MTDYSRGQQAQIVKRLKLRGTHKFTARDKKCVVCGHRFNGPACMHTITENQEVIGIFSPQLDAWLDT